MFSSPFTNLEHIHLFKKKSTFLAFMLKKIKGLTNDKNWCQCFVVYTNLNFFYLHEVVVDKMLS